METLKVNNYLSEIQEEIIEKLESTNGIFLCAGCGLGKSYLIREVLMKRYKCLNVNFLNILNNQNFQDTYEEGKKSVLEYKGTESKTINVANLQFVTTECLNNLELLIVDEIHNTHFHATFRRCCGDSLVEQLQRFKEAGVKILVVSGTPIGGISLGKRLGLTSIKVEKKNIEEKDKYIFTFREGLNCLNVADFALNLENQGKTVLIITDLNRKQIRRGLIKAGAEFGEIQSDDRSREGTVTKYLIDNQRLPERYNIFLSTGVLNGGVNILDTSEEREIVYVTFIRDIENPMNLIQLAGRSRNQSKVVECGYSNEEDFNINFIHTLYDNRTNDIYKSTSVQELETLLGNNINKLSDWVGYIKCFCQSVEIFKDSFDTHTEKAETEETDWQDFIKVVMANKKSQSISFYDYFKVKCETNNHLQIIDSPRNSSIKWIYTLNVRKARNILRLLDLGFSIEDISNEKLTRLLNVVYIARTFLNLTETGYDGLKQDVIDNKLDLSLGAVRDSFSDIFKISRYVNGKEETLADWHKSSRVSLPIYVFQNYKNTVSALVRRLSTNDISKMMKTMKEYTVYFEWEDKVVEEAIEKKKEAGKEALSKGGSKGGSKSKRNKKIKVINDSHKKLKGYLGKEFSSCEEAMNTIGVSINTITSMIKKKFLEVV